VLDAIAEGYQCLAVDAKDRFGDYGLVGVMVFDRCGDALGVNTLLLSCRALGRGIEHRMLSRLGQIASESNLGRVAIAYNSTAKNTPGLEFLESVSGKQSLTPTRQHVYEFMADHLKALRYEPSGRPVTANRLGSTAESGLSLPRVKVLGTRQVRRIAEAL